MLAVPELRWSVKERCIQGVEPTQRREEKCVAGSRSGKGQAAQPFEIRHGTTGLEFALLGFGLNIGPHFPRCVRSVSSLWKDNAQSALL